MSQDTDLQSNYNMSQLDAHAAAMFLLRRELLVYTENEGPVGINPVLPSIRPNLFEDVKFVGDNASHLRKALRCFMEKQGKDFDPDTDVLEALVLAASKHLFPSPPPKGTRGHPPESEVFRFTKASEYLIAAGQVATLLELRNQKTTQAEICREIIRRTWKMNGREFSEEEVHHASREGEEGRLSSAKRELSRLLKTVRMKREIVRKNLPLLSHIQWRKITYEWAPSKTEMELYPQWKTIYAKHNFIKKLSTRQR